MPGIIFRKTIGCQQHRPSSVTQPGMNQVPDAPRRFPL
jgi:hypothetical protein